MELDFDAMLDGLTGVLKDSLEQDIPAIKEYAKKIIDEEKEMLTQLGELRLTGAITDDEFKAELEGQKEVVKNQMLALGVMSAAASQKAANAAIDFLRETVLSAVKALL